MGSHAKNRADGEWQHTIVDDKLYLRAGDFDEIPQDERVIWDDINRVDSAEEYRKAHQSGSRALYFAQCSDENETWLPLLEKAYAKAHGDFASIDGGFTGEAIEDLTGGVTTEIYSTDILDREAFWRDELMQVGKSFLFGCATGFYSNWLDTSAVPREREGIAEGHAYSIMDAKEIKGERLLKLRNPWGKKEWTGKWSDGSSEWTAEWMQLLDHKFGNDGIFWISYEDLLKKYQHFDRTRIFGPEWNVTQRWTSVNVSWSAQYHSTKFSLVLEEKAPVVIVLSQLDEMYLNGLEGGYEFDLQFRLESDGKEDENDYIVRSNGSYAMARSVSTDIELEAGTYWVLMKITATRHADREHLEDVLPVYAATRREKLIQMGLSYDLAHAKGVVVETQEEKQERKAHRKAQRVKEREKLKQRMKSQAEKHWKREKERHKRERERRNRNIRRRERKKRANSNMQEEGFLDGPDSLDSATPEKPGSLEVQKAESPTLENGLAEDDHNPDSSTRALKLKSFRGKDIASPRQPPTSREEESVSADRIVEPLEDVIKVADVEELTNQPEDSHEDQVEAGEEPEEKPPTPIVQVNGVNTITDVKPLPTLPPLSRPEHELANDTAVPSGKPGRIVMRDSPQRSETLDTTAAIVDAGDGSEASINRDGMTEWDEVVKENNNDDNDHAALSDSDSFPPFDWNSDLDMPSDLSDSDGDSSTFSRPGDARYSFMSARREGGPSRRPVGISPPRPPVPGDAETGKGGVDDGEGPDEPWNAVCVVGLRVYSTLPGDKVKLRVVRPRDWESEDEDEDDEETNKQETHTNDDYNPGRELGSGKKKTTSDSEFPLDPDDISKGAVATEPESTGVEVKFDKAAKLTSAPVSSLRKSRGREEKVTWDSDI